MNMINSADDLDLYNEYMHMYIDPDREYLIMKFIAIGFSLSICAAILFFKIERNKKLLNRKSNHRNRINRHNNITKIRLS